MSERLYGALSESEVQTLTLGFQHSKGPKIESMSLRMPVRQHLDLEIQIRTLLPEASVYDVETIVNLGAQKAKRISTIEEMTALFQVAKHMEPEAKITHELGYELQGAINRLLLEHRAQAESLESLRKALGL